MHKLRHTRVTLVSVLSHIMLALRYMLLCYILTHIAPVTYVYYYAQNNHILI